MRAPIPMITVVITLFLILILFTGCIEPERYPPEPPTSKDKSEKAIEIALKNDSVKQYLTGDYDIIDVYDSTLTQNIEGKEYVYELTVVQVETANLTLFIYTDVEEEKVIQIHKRYRRFPDIPTASIPR